MLHIIGSKCTGSLANYLQKSSSHKPAVFLGSSAIKNVNFAINIEVIDFTWFTAKNYKYHMATDFIFFQILIRNAGYSTTENEKKMQFAFLNHFV